MKTKLTVKCSEEEVAVWKEAAWEQRVSLSEWVRSSLTARAAKLSYAEELTDARRGLVAGEQPGRSESDVPKADSKASSGGILDRPPGHLSADAPAPAASPCKRAHLHHTNHGGRPCPVCGWPT